MNGYDEVPLARITELTHEHIEIVPYDAEWLMRFAKEEARLLRSLPADLVIRIDHIGSTAVPGLSAKPIIDVQVEVSSLERVRREVVPIMKDLAYEFIWRPTIGEHGPFYAWFIKRNAKGERTVHVHMVEPDEASEDRLLFRDHLRAHPHEAQRYEALKQGLAHAHPDDRAAYTLSKTPFIAEVIREAREARYGSS
jgi:GrpB-like predicted nucleotidyltransferase (UPF0157 family)